MAFTLPEQLAALVASCPLKQKTDREALARGNLAYGAMIYARRAAHHGDMGDWWRVWREIQVTRDKSLSEAIEELQPTQRMWFASWCRKHHELEAFLVAYGAYLKDPGEIGPFPRDTVPYLDELARVRGWKAATTALDELSARDDDLFEEEVAVARMLLEAGEKELAKVRFTPFFQRHHDSADAWLLSAMFASGDVARARVALGEAAKLGGEDSGLLNDALTKIGFTQVEWKKLKEGWPVMDFDYDASIQAAGDSPPLRLVPGKQPSPHVYGGSHFKMPACLGCGHQIHEWFTLDLRETPSVDARMKVWGYFPLLGCADCNMMFGRHDYEVDIAGRTIRLVNVINSAKKSGKPLITLAPPPLQPVNLEPVARPDTDSLSFSSLVGGSPIWVQEPLRIFCRTCRAPMIYVASLTSTYKFDPEIPINEAGWNYHFACDRCRTISVVIQCS